MTNVGAPNGVVNISAIEWDLTTPTAPDEADLSLDLSVTDPAPTAETNVTFTVTLTNGGPDSATGVQVTDLLPSGFTYVSHIASAGTYAPETGLWTVGTVASAAAPTLQIVATVHAGGLHTNTAEVTSTGTYDTDSVPGSSEGDTFDSVRSAPPAAQTLYAASGTGTLWCNSNGDSYEDGSASSLYELDPLDGDIRKIADITIGSTQALAVSGLAVHPSTGVLYGFLNRQDPVDCEFDPAGPGTLVTIDKTTGAATVVGSMGAAAIVAPDIAFDPFGTLYAWNMIDNDLYTLDTTTGAATKVDECDCFPNGRLGLAVDSAGRMYLKTINELFRVSPFTGTLVSPVSLSDSAPRDMLAFGPNDVLYTGSRESFNFLGRQVFGLWTLDTDGTANLLGSNQVQNISALAWDLGPITAPDQADLSLTKDVNDSTPDNWFQEVTFTITVDNDGPDDATDVEVTDLLPSGLELRERRLGRRLQPRYRDLERRDDHQWELSGTRDRGKRPDERQLHEHRRGHRREYLRPRFRVGRGLGAGDIRHRRPSRLRRLWGSTCRPTSSSAARARRMRRARGSRWRSRTSAPRTSP